MSAAYWVNEDELAKHTDIDLAELIEQDILNNWTPTANERNLLMLIRSGNKTQQERAFAQFRQLYPAK